TGIGSVLRVNGSDTTSAAGAAATVKSLFWNFALPVTVIGKLPTPALAAGFRATLISLAPLGMFLSAGATFGGTPAAVRAISSSKPAARVAVTVSDAEPPRSTSGASNLAASVYGGFSVTAMATCVRKSRGGYGSPPSDAETG